MARRRRTRSRRYWCMVTSLSGLPAPDTQVELLAWPSNDALAAGGPGSDFQLTDLGTGTTDSAGRSQFAMPDQADLSLQTGYDTAKDTDRSYTFSAKGHACGTAGWPGDGAPGKVVATD